MVYTDKIHLVADTLEELHSFAQLIGIGKWYYEGVRKGHPHYDIPKKKLKTVLEADVKVVSPREVLEISKKAMLKDMNDAFAEFTKDLGKKISEAGLFSYARSKELFDYWGEFLNKKAPT